MANSSSASSRLDDRPDDSSLMEPTVPSALKFLASNLKNFVTILLAPDNYVLWHSQISKIFRANGLSNFLDITVHPPTSRLTQSDGSTCSNPLYLQWVLTDQNLAAALCSKISPTILPYVVNLESTAAIWNTLETRFKSTNRSKVIQLNNELHNVSLKNSTMTQYLSEIKSLVDQIAAADSQIDSEDILLYILKGLPSSYQSFKTSIRTMLQPISLDQLYSLLLSEEIHQAADAAVIPPIADSNTALVTLEDEDVAAFADHLRILLPLLVPQLNLRNLLQEGSFRPILLA